MKQKMFVKDLKPGMFVNELDRPWLDTPYLLQGFLIKSNEDIEEVGKYCEYVFIDPLKAQYAGQTSRIGLFPDRATGPSVKRGKAYRRC